MCPEQILSHGTDPITCLVWDRNVARISKHLHRSGFSLFEETWFVFTAPAPKNMQLLLPLSVCRACAGILWVTLNWQVRKLGHGYFSCTFQAFMFSMTTHSVKLLLWHWQLHVIQRVRTISAEILLILFAWVAVTYCPSSCWIYCLGGWCGKCDSSNFILLHSVVFVCLPTCS